MRAIVGLLIICSAVGSYAYLPDTQVIGGSDASIQDHPYMVSIRENYIHFCGGSIVSKRYVLTAAHCVSKFASRIRGLKGVSLHLRTHFLNETGFLLFPQKLFLHENYYADSVANDIALLYINWDIPFSDLMKPIPLATTDIVKEGDSCLLTGWGRLEVDGMVPNRLQKLNLRIFSQNRCENTFKKISNKHICAFSQYGEGAHEGDAGSPVIANGVQIGVASYYYPCAEAYPDVYMRVSSFKDWLAKYLKDEIK